MSGIFFEDFSGNSIKHAYGLVKLGEELSLAIKFTTKRGKIAYFVC